MGSGGAILGQLSFPYLGGTSSGAGWPVKRQAFEWRNRRRPGSELLGSSERLLCLLLVVEVSLISSWGTVGPK